MEHDGGDEPPEGTPSAGIVERGRAVYHTGRQRAEDVVAERQRRPVIDVVLRIYERDRDAAGSVVGSAIAFRLFLFVVPMLLFVVGVIGFLTSLISRADVRHAGISGTLADQIDAALSQGATTRAIAVIVGFVGMALAGRSLSRTMVQASCLNWQVTVRTKTPVRLVGGVIGVVAGVGFVAAVVNKVRADLGIGVTTLSFLAALGVYVASWLVLTVMLPRPTTDPGSLLPGAVVMGVTLTGLQVVSQLYLPSKLDRVSSIYGGIASTIVVLGWFFIVGRALVLAMAVNAVVFERFGSISQFVFGLPVLRALPRRWPRLGRFFELER
jgi:uncharacterized BrkB/YihY/UPF0761 family membrane protein